MDDLVANGYDLSEAEFMNDLRLRDLFEKMFHDPRLCNFDQPITSMRERVAAADTKLQALFVADARKGRPEAPWWHRGILSNGHGEYAADVEGRYGVRLPNPNSGKTE